MERDGEYRRFSDVRYESLELTSEDVTPSHDGKIERAAHVHYAVFQRHIYCERLIYISLYLSIAANDSPSHSLQRTFPKKNASVGLHVAHENSPVHVR